MSERGGERGGERGWLHAAVWGYTALHFAVAGAVPLAAFESHYALYASRPALSYVDHPPMIAWLEWLVLQVDDRALALRTVPLALAVVAMYLLAALTRRCYPDGPRWLPLGAVVVLQGTLVFHLGMTVSPDAPLLAFGLAVVLLTFSALEQDRWRDWLVLGLALGLAGLSKYTAGTLALSLLGIVLWRRGVRGVVEPKLWLAGLLALACISPVLIWNAQHDWVTLAFHGGYQVRTDEPSAWSLSTLVSAQAEQLLFYSPLVYIGGIWLMVRRLPRATTNEAILYAYAVPVLGLFVLASLTSRGSAHWSLLGWVLLIPPLVNALAAAWSRRAMRALCYVSAGYSVVGLLAIAVVLLPVPRWPDFAHPMRAVVGWQRASERAQELLQASALDGESPELLVRNWHHAERLAWYGRPRPVLNVLDRFSPYTFMFGNADRALHGVLVYPTRTLEPKTAGYLWPGFDCRPVDALPIFYGASLAHVFHFYRCQRPAASPGNNQ